MFRYAWAFNNTDASWFLKILLLIFLAQFFYAFLVHDTGESHTLLQNLPLTGERRGRETGRLYEPTRPLTSSHFALSTRRHGLRQLQQRAPT